MSLLRVQTKPFLELLTDLSHTAAVEGHEAGVLLHSTRGYADPNEPGETDLLVGTSSTAIHIGHTWCAASGQTTPMLWPINDVRAVLSVFKVLAKGEKEHGLDIRHDGDEITVAEDPTLFGETSLRFTASPLDDYPRDRWRALTEGALPERDTEPAARTDFDPTVLAVFTKVARRRGENLQTYRYHQRSPILVQIGDTYRGALMPSARWDRDNPGAGHGPGSDLYPPELPNPDSEVA